MIDKQKTIERFIRYAKIPTGSIPNIDRTPTTDAQFVLARLLKEELVELGVSDVYLDEYACVVYGKIPANIEAKYSVGFVAHMDTSFDVKNDDVKPWVYKDYQGEDVLLNQDLNITITPKEFPNLLNYIGSDIIFTDGTTLLGGDDKAAITEVMMMAEYLLCHKEVLHPTICIAFTPDEEVGGLAKDLDFKRFGADIAYTIDGDYVGYYSDETFNAIEAQVSIQGKNVHPGTAKGIMKNAIEIAMEWISMLPKERPQNTEGRVGFYHPHYFDGTVETAKVYTLLRDHDENEFNHKKEVVKECCDAINQKYGENTATLKFANGYFSMKKVVDKYPFMIEELVGAIIDSGIKPTHLPFRGGTDGSAISQRGLPCPNISAGYENGHSKYEYVPVDSMLKITEILIRLTERLGRL